jgi:hypothetical protein
MNNLMPIIASDRPLAFAVRLSLLLSLLFCFGLLFMKLVRFVQLFEVDLVSTPAIQLVQ